MVNFTSEKGVSSIWKTDETVAFMRCLPESENKRVLSLGGTRLQSGAERTITVKMPAACFIFSAVCMVVFSGLTPFFVD
ncbi:hypothetical protein [Bacillus sp. NSP9.1]|uniref:hypothetical protein n=1 Tax=Bacillus sp. NSP9.1 TaxID=1071078 RepID=UPI001268359E|nr:hypothetical protein [Bacillus sp. NSP9.1]QHZ47950.1 hypothetical protein M654_017465 [Bacillus sp. NSP9.1]